MFGNVGSTLSSLSSQYYTVYIYIYIYIFFFSLVGKAQYYTVWMWLAMLTNGKCAQWFYPMEYTSLPNPTTPVHKNLQSLSPLFFRAWKL